MYYNLAAFSIAHNKTMRR